MLFRLILINLFILSGFFSLAEEVRGSKKIVIEESVVSFKPTYTYEYSIGPNQTPYTLSRGMFKIDFIVYSQGSVLLKLHVGLWEFLTVGIVEDIQGIIGNSPITMNIPLASMKLNIINEMNSFSLSVAIDSFSYGLTGKAFSPDYYSKTLYGIHLPMSIRYKSIFNSYSDLVFGAKFPILPVGDVNVINTALFLSTYVKFSEVFAISFGVDNLFLSSERVTNSSIFSEFKFSPTRSLGLSLILNYSFLPSFERIIKIEYIGNLF